MLKTARPLALLLVLAIVAVSIWTPLADADVAARWFTWPGMLWFAPVPILVLAGVALLLRSLAGKTPHHGPFLASLGLIFLGYTGLAISIWPNIVPPTLSIWAAASSESSQGFTLVGTLFILPFTLMYSAFSYYVFRGKVKLGEGYH
jgi:cytochrome d ubiquinol oxidase subunit II